MRERRARRVGERAEVAQEAVDLRGRDAQVRGHRRAGVTELAQARQRRSGLGQQRRQPPHGLCQVAALTGGALADGGRAVDEVRHPPPAGGELGDDGVGLVDQGPEPGAVAVDDRQHPVGLLERGVGAADGGVEVLGPTGEPGAELVDDHAEAFAVGQAPLIAFAGLCLMYENGFL